MSLLKELVKIFGNSTNKKQPEDCGEKDKEALMRRREEEARLKYQEEEEQKIEEVLRKIKNRE